MTEKERHSEPAWDRIPESSRFRNKHVKFDMIVGNGNEYPAGGMSKVSAFSGVCMLFPHTDSALGMMLRKTSNGTSGDLRWLQ